MTDTGAPLFSAVVSSPRLLHHLLNTISFSSRVQVRITAEGIRFAATETGVLDAFIFLPKAVFTSFRLSPLPDTESIIFTLPLPTLLSTLQILSTAAAPDATRATSDAFAAHRLNRHAAFSASLLGTSGQCRLVYRAPGAKLELSVPETSGMRTACSLATFLDDAGGEEIPFDRAEVRVKAILPAGVLGDALAEVAALGPPEVLVVDGARSAPYLVLRGEGGSEGECRVEFADEGLGKGRTRLLETFSCAGRVRARYGLGTVKKALLAMRAGAKVSLRLDGNGVMSLQFLVEVGEAQEDKEQMAFVDFKIVPLYEEGSEGEEEEEEE